MPATCGVAGCDLLSPIAVAGRVNPAVNRAVVQVLAWFWPGLPTPHRETAVLNQAVPAGATSAACRIRGDKDEFPHIPLFLVVAHCPSHVNIFWKESSN